MEAYCSQWQFVLGFGWIFKLNKTQVPCASMELLASIQFKSCMAQVLVRIRPSPRLANCVKAVGTDSLRVNTGQTAEQLKFDAVGDTYSQQDVFEEIGLPVITSLKAGKNSLVVCLGQENSGKSHTLFGSDCQLKGLVQMTVHDLRVKGFETTIACCQILNEQVMDLLSPISRIRQVKEVCGVNTILQLTQLKLLPTHNISTLIQSALRNRRSPNPNFQNQRRGSVLIVTLKTGRGPSQTSKVEFVELSGPGIEGDADTGSAYLGDKSINAFLKFVDAPKWDKLSFSESKLTQILRGSLLNPTKRYIIAHVRPQKRYLQGTLSTLQIANRCKSLGEQVKQSLTAVLKTEDTIPQKMAVSPRETRRDTLARTPSRQNVLGFNQRHLKKLIEVYQHRISRGDQPSQYTTQIENKILEGVAQYQAVLMNNFPTLTEICRQSQDLRRKTTQETVWASPSKWDIDIPGCPAKLVVAGDALQNSETIKRQNILLEQYEGAMGQLKAQFAQKLSELSYHYEQLQKKYNRDVSRRRTVRTSSISYGTLQEHQGLQELEQELESLRSQNESLRLKNADLESKMEAGNQEWEQLDQLREKLVEIKDSICQDEQVETSHLRQLDHLRRQLSQKGSAQLHIVVKNSAKALDNSDYINETSQTVLMGETRGGHQGNTDGFMIRKDDTFRLTQRPQRRAKRAPDSTNQLRQINNTCLPLESSIRFQSRAKPLETPESKPTKKKQSSQLERLRLILLRSKEKANRTKLNYVQSLRKSNMGVCKSSAFLDYTASPMVVNRSGSRPDLGQSLRLPHKRTPGLNQCPSHTVLGSNRSCHN